MVAPIVVEISGDVDLRSARRDTGRAFKEISRDADRAADDIRSSFRDIGEKVGDELDDAARDADRAFTRMEREAEDTADGIARAFGDAGDDVAREISTGADRAEAALDGISNVDVKIDVDTSEVGGAERDIRSLDSIPPPTIDIDVDAEGAVTDIEDTFAGIDLSDMGSSIVGQLGTILAVGGPLAALAATAGAQVGGSLATGFGRGFSANRNQALDAVKFGLSGPEMADVGRSAGAAWSAGFGESLGELRNTALVLENTLGAVDESLNLEGATRQAQALSDVFGVEIADSARLARRLVANELAPDTVTAFNIMGAAAQKYRLDQDEIFDVLSEFAPVFSKLGVDGAQAMNIIGQAVQRGLLPNVDRAAELFEEFNIEVTTGGAKDALEEIGFSSERMQEALASGRGAQALAVVATELLKIEDAAERDRLAVDLFGASIESAADPEAVLGLLATADAVGEVGTAMADAVAVTEQTATGFEGATRKAEGLGAAFGGFLATSIGNAHDDFFDLTDALGVTGDGMKGVASEADLAADRMLGMRAQADDTALSFDDLAGEVVELDDALSDFSRRFDADRIFRSINDDVRTLTEATAELTAADFTLTDGFDTTTAAGSRAEAQLERLSGNLDELVQGYDEGTVTARQFDAGSAAVEAAIRAVAGQMGLTEAATQRLIDKYGSIPSEVTTEITVIDRARGTIDQIAARINAIPRSVSVSVNRSFRGFAHGGLAEGFGVVGEEGPELIDFRTPTRVYSNSDSRRILDGDQGSGGPSFAQMVAAFTAALSALPSGGNRTIENLNVGDGSADLWRELYLADATYGPVNA